MGRREDEDPFVPPVGWTAAGESARRLQIIERIAAALDRPIEDFFLPQADSEDPAVSGSEGQDQEP